MVGFEYIMNIIYLIGSLCNFFFFFFTMAMFNNQLAKFLEISLFALTGQWEPS